MSIRKKLIGSEHPDLANSYCVLGYVLVRQGRFPEAEEMFRAVLALQRKSLGNEHPDTAITVSSLATVLREEGKLSEAERLYRECLAVREKILPDAWYTFYTQLRLGGTLLEQKKYAEAEPLLFPGYRGMKERQRNIPNPTEILREGLQLLVTFCEATGRLDQAAEWQQKLAELEKAQTEQKPAAPLR